MKEGLELRPIRHFSEHAVKGAIFIAFLASSFINLTLSGSLAKNGPVKMKLLKKFLINLTLVVIYPRNAFRLRIVSNISKPLMYIFGDFLRRYEDKNLHLRW